MKNRTLVAIAVSAALAAGATGCRAGYEAAYETGYEAGYEAGRNNPKSVWELTHKVVRVIDGDTLVLENGEKVRLIGIDAPEKKGNEYFNVQSTRGLEGLVLGKFVRLERDKTIRGPRGRLLAYLRIDDIFVNRELVRNGYARASPYGKDRRYEAQFAADERLAKAEGLGMWARER